MTLRYCGNSTFTVSARAGPGQGTRAGPFSAAKLFNTTRSSAEHVRSGCPATNSKGVARAISSSSKGSAASERATPTPPARSRTTRFARANTSGSAIRAGNSPRNASATRRSPPNPDKTVRSTSRVTRGSPYRWRASPPMKQNAKACRSQNACTAAAAANSSITRVPAARRGARRGAAARPTRKSISGGAGAPHRQRHPRAVAAPRPCRCRAALAIGLLAAPRRPLSSRARSPCAEGRSPVECTPSLPLPRHPRGRQSEPRGPTRWQSSGGP